MPLATVHLLGGGETGNSLQGGPATNSYLVAENIWPCAIGSFSGLGSSASTACPNLFAESRKLNRKLDFDGLKRLLADLSILRSSAKFHPLRLPMQCKGAEDQKELNQS